MLTLNNSELGLVAVILGGACAILLYVLARRHVLASGTVDLAQASPFATHPSFLFRGDTLIDATPKAQRLFESRPAGLSDFQGLVHLLAPRFSDIKAVATELEPDQIAQIDADDCSDLTLHLSRSDDLIRIWVEGANTSGQSAFAPLEKEAMQAEIEQLRTMIHHAPQLLWREDAQGALSWANPAYLALADRNAPKTAQQSPVWPQSALFESLGNPTPAGRPAHPQRVSLQLPGEMAEHWFDVTSIADRDGVLHYASGANAVVKAEMAKQAFMQTLSKTFAHLSIGLAIFDKRRQLTMFNPAIQEMTGLPFSFLSARPTLDMVLDQLRELRKLPEPRDYSTWREQFTALEAAAKNGTYSENWDLPDGMTFRVTGRPHPDGAIAFLFEDISAEVSLTRRFRTEIETGQSVLDSLPDAIAVFSNAQTLVMSNLAYDQLWDHSDQGELMTHDLAGALRRWKLGCAPTGLWKGIEDFSTLARDRSPISESIMLLDGRKATCMATPLSGGMIMVRFGVQRPGQGLMPRMVGSGENLRVAKG